MRSLALLLVCTPLLTGFALFARRTSSLPETVGVAGWDGGEISATAGLVSSRAIGVELCFVGLRSQKEIISLFPVYHNSEA